jgi:hypothetical protein
LRHKVRDDAVHFVVGFEHQPSPNASPARTSGSASESRDIASPGTRGWKFTRWDLVDLANIKVKLKAEFQGSNRDVYRPEAIVASSANQKN